MGRRRAADVGGATQQLTARGFVRDLQLLATWSASADVLALSSVEYNISAVRAGHGRGHCRSNRFNLHSNRSVLSRVVKRTAVGTTSTPFDAAASPGLPFGSAVRVQWA